MEEQSAGYNGSVPPTQSCFPVSLCVCFLSLTQEHERMMHVLSHSLTVPHLLFSQNGQSIAEDRVTNAVKVRIFT